MLVICMTESNGFGKTLLGRYHLCFNIDISDRLKGTSKIFDDVIRQVCKWLYCLVKPPIKVCKVVAMSKRCLSNKEFESTTNCRYTFRLNWTTGLYVKKCRCARRRHGQLNCIFPPKTKPLQGKTLLVSKLVHNACSHSLANSLKSPLDQLHKRQE